MNLTCSIGRCNSFLFFHSIAKFSVRRISEPLPLLGTLFAATAHPLRAYSNPVRMESPDLPHTSATEDFVHIETPKVCTDTLSESIVNVEEELPRVDSEVVGSDPVPSQSFNRPISSCYRDYSGRAGETGINRLPEKLSRTVVHLTCDSVASESGTCDVYLVGTAHVSIESCHEVQAVINILKPEVVFLELCASRVAFLTPQNLKVPTLDEMIDMYKRKHNMFAIAYSWFLAKVACKLDVIPGSEFRVAFEEARKYDANVVLGDRPVQVTLKRTWAKMPLWHKTKLVFSLFFQTFFLPSAEDFNKMLKDMDNVDMLTLVVQEMSKQFPTLLETLINERDQYMSSKLLAVASEHASVVAVVGKGHLQGIKRHWKQPVQISDLMELPAEQPAVSTKRILASIGVGVAGVAVLSALYLSKRK